MSRAGSPLPRTQGNLRPPGLWLVSVPVHVQQPQPGGLQPLHRDLGEALHQLVSEAGVLVALLPQAHPIQLKARTGVSARTSNS